MRVCDMPRVYAADVSAAGCVRNDSRCQNDAQHSATLRLPNRTVRPVASRTSLKSGAVHTRDCSTRRTRSSLTVVCTLGTCPATMPHPMTELEAKQYQTKVEAALQVTLSSLFTPPAFVTRDPVGLLGTQLVWCGLCVSVFDRCNAQ